MAAIILDEVDEYRQAQLDQLLTTIKECGGFLTPSDLDQLVKLDLGRLVLVRCGGGRFLCPAQDARHFIEIVEADERDYVRDISLPSRAWGAESGQ